MASVTTKIFLLKGINFSLLSIISVQENDYKWEKKVERGSGFCAY